MVESSDEWMELPMPKESAWLTRPHGRGALGDLALDHVGIAVRDVDEAIDRFSTLLGLHDWSRTEISTTVTFRGVEQNVGAIIAVASMGPIDLELVQPTHGSWTPVDVLDKLGEGLFHLGFRVTDVGATTHLAEDAALQAADVGMHGDEPTFTISDGGDLHGVCLEFVAPRMPKAMVTSFEHIPYPSTAVEAPSPSAT